MCAVYDHYYYYGRLPLIFISIAFTLLHREHRSDPNRRFCCGLLPPPLHPFASRQLPFSVCDNFDGILLYVMRSLYHHSAALRKRLLVDYCSPFNFSEALKSLKSLSLLS